MSDFSPETRNSAIWSGDSRKVAAGKANEVILTKMGSIPIEDLSDVEAVQMGHVMEPVIGRLAQAKLGVELNKIEGYITHSKESWLKSHFDFVGQKDGQQILVECKNYSASVRSKFDVENSVMPVSDMAQLVHEASVFGNSEMYLAVLFGGQEFVLIHKQITEQDKNELIKTMSEIWGRVQAKNPYPPETPEQARLLYPQSTDEVVTAPKHLEAWCQQLHLIKNEIKRLEASESELAASIQSYMKNGSTLVSVAGDVLATWKSAKPSKRFDSKLFQSAMPDIYKQFEVETPGTRRFLVKG